MERCKHGYVIGDGFSCEHCQSLYEDDDLCDHGRTTGAVCLQCDAEKLDSMPEPTTDEGWRELYKSQVDSPKHYTVGGYESIDVIHAKLTPEEYRGFLKGNVMKYLNRANYKGHHDMDCEKAEWYLKRLVKELKSVANASKSS